LLAETQLHEMQVEEWIEGMDRSISHLASWGEDKANW
jgi:hypothetical protein